MSVIARLFHKSTSVHPPVCDIDGNNSESSRPVIILWKYNQYYFLALP